MAGLDWEAVDALADRARGRAEGAELLRELPPETVAEAEAAGIWSMSTPPRFGGDGAGIRELADLARRLAHGCTSTGWTVSFLAMHNWLLTRYPEPVQEALWAERPFVLAPAPLAPGGSAVVADGGLRVSGRWEWATGVMHGDWVLVHVMVDGPAPDMRFALVPLDQVEVIDVWHTAGMRATGSNTVALDDVFVPDDFLVDAGTFFAGPGRAEPDYPFGAYPVIPVLALVAAAPAVGAAERCVELFTDRIAARTLAYSLGDRQADQQASRVRLGGAVARVQSLRRSWEAAIDDLVEVVEGPDEATLAQRAGWRAAATLAVDAARCVVDDIAVGAGASVYFEDHPLQRYQRDLNTLKGHAIFDLDRTMDLVGAVALGQDPPSPML